MNGRGRVPDILAGVIPVHNLGRTREQLVRQIPDPMRAIPNHDHLVRLSYPTPARLDVQLPAEWLGLRQGRPITWLLHTQRAAVGRPSCPLGAGGVDTRGLDLAPS